MARYPNAWPVAGSIDGGGIALAISTSSARVALPTAGSSTLTLTASEDCYIRFGSDAIEAGTTSGTFTAFIPAGMQVERNAPGTATHIAAISTGTGTLIIEPRV